MQMITATSVIASDTNFVLLKIRGMELVPEVWDKGAYLQHQIISTMQHEWKRKSFVIITSDDTARYRSIKPKFAIEINILELHINDPVINQQNKMVSRDVTTNNYRDEAEDQRKEHAAVNADMTILEKSQTGILRISVATVNVPEAVTYWSELLVESYNWENKSATYTGSFQALGSKEVLLVRSKERPVPKPEDIYRDMVRQCINKSSSRIANSINPKTGG